MLSGIESYYQTAFGYLSPSRASGMGLSSISLTEYELYFSVFDCPHDIRKFCRILHRIDSAYLEEAHKARESQANKRH